ncbi:MAG: glycoside hydrolase family 88 protein [Bacteroides sp.]|nr:glycoside hydrolase family 88 protein [Bacteroides sp.]
MKHLSILLLASIFVVLTSCGDSGSQPGKVDMEAIGHQLHLLDKNTKKIIADSSDAQLVSPRTISEDGSLRVVPGGDWTSGFFSGTLWYMYEMSEDESWKKKATEYTVMLEKEQYNGSNHDVGFRMFCSYGNALRLTNNEAYIPVLIQSANTLIARYYEEVGCIRSWDFNDTVWQCPVIIDNMMNLELLFWATEQTGDPVYREIAISHALTTLKHHFREDHSTVHVVDYDTITGEVRQKYTHQGYADESSWARGQAWGLYGYTMCYRFTKDLRFLLQAEHIADFLLNNVNMPEDGVPYWDFDDPGIPEVPRDVSAAAIISSALYELSTYSDRGESYKIQAERILMNTWSLYRSMKDANFGFILDHSVGNMPGGSEIDVPLNYADYYFMEALYRSQKF